MDEQYLFDKILGGLYGQALGDAFAMPAYLHPKDTREKYGDWITDFHPGPPDHPVHFGLAAGQVTDDTEQAMALAEMIIQEKGITVKGAAQALVNWYESIDGDNSPYVGPSSRKACQALKAGADPTMTGNQGDTDGGAMRISPIGLINPGNPQQAVKDAATACTPSHNTRVAISGAAAVAGAIAEAMKENNSLDDVLQAGIQSAEEGEKYGHTWLGASVPRRIKLALEIASQEKAVFDRIVDLYDVIGSTLATSETVPSAFGVLSLSGGDITLCAQYSAAISGDADTVGAIACAIAGAWNGYEKFPKKFIKKITEANAVFNFEGTAKGLFEVAKGRVK
ncbi:MAG: ADP-ribosylglycohydrolase family protein [Anaerolineales bacterium]